VRIDGVFLSGLGGGNFLVFFWEFKEIFYVCFFEDEKFFIIFLLADKNFAFDG
jgi:hypothetical protein